MTTDPAQSHCRNCGARLRGPWCHHCGQREDRLDLRFGSVLGDLVADLLRWDSRFWRTMVPLLVRPGFLTAEFIAGRRARYAPPLRLYLIISFILFLVLNLGSGLRIYIGDEAVFLPDGSAPRTTDGPAEAITETGSVTDAAGADAAVSVEEGDQEIIITPKGLVVPEGANDIDVDLGNFGQAEKPVWVAQLERRFEENLRRLAEGDSRLSQSTLEHLPQMMFILLPLFALVVWVAYLFSPFHYLQHLVFALHYHTFVFLLFLLALLVQWLRPGEYLGWVVLALFVYLPSALVRVYGSGWGGAIGKTLFIAFAYGVMLAIALTLLVLLSILLL
jgi:hypothetical protein